MLKSNVFVYILLFVLAFKIDDGITIQPKRCPSNKIAPHRRIINTYKPRTLGHLFELFGDNNVGYGGGASNLQEQPQEDDPDDCGEIEDYDENDLSSLTVNNVQQRDRPQNKLFFNWLSNKPQISLEPQQQGFRPPVNSRPPYDMRPPQSRPPPRPRPPVRPPLPTYPQQRPPNGGYFANNPYRPPYQQYPSDAVKPVHEYQVNDESPVNYRPGVVGGQVGQIVGVPVRPVRPPPSPPTTYRPITVPYPNTTLRPNYYQTTRRTRPRDLYYNNSVVGSFVDLFFK